MYASNHAFDLEWYELAQDRPGLEIVDHPCTHLPKT